MSDYKRPDAETLHKLHSMIDWETSEAAPDHVLNTQLMDSRIAKTELEWYASRRIAELERQLAEYKAVVEWAEPRLYDIDWPDFYVRWPHLAKEERPDLDFYVQQAREELEAGENE